MAGSGKAKFLAGLESLNQSLENIHQRRRQLLHDMLAVEESKQRGEERSGRIREANQKRQDSLKAILDKRREALGEQAQRGRVMKNLQSGDIERATRIAFNRKIPLSEHTVRAFSPDEDKGPSSPFQLWLRDNPGGTHEQYIRDSIRAGSGGSAALSPDAKVRALIEGEQRFGDEASDVASQLRGMTIGSTLEGVPLIDEPGAVSNRARSAYTRASSITDTPMPKEEPQDEFSLMGADEWNDYVSRQMAESTTDLDEDEFAIFMVSPEVLSLKNAVGKDRQRLYWSMGKAIASGKKK